MEPLAKFVGAVLVGALALFAAPTAQAQVGVNINVGAPAWGPQVPYGTQYYYIPEIDGYYDLYNQQYIVYQDGYWMPLPQLYGYDPYQFHPVIVDYRGPQPWRRVDYYRQRYAYRPYRNYGPGRGYYNGGNGYGRPRYNNRGGYSNGYGDRDRDDRGGYRGNDNRDRDHEDRGGYRGSANWGNDRDSRGQYLGGNNNSRSNPMPQQPTQQPQQGGGGYNTGQGNHGGGQGDGNNSDGRGNGGNQGGGGNRGGGGHDRS